MEVRKIRQVDSAEPDADGFADYFYEYDVYEFSDRELCFVARSYTDNLHEAHFLRKQTGDQRSMLEANDFQHPLFLLALAALKNDGKTEFNFLSQKSGSYAPVPVGT